MLAVVVDLNLACDIQYERACGQVVACCIDTVSLLSQDGYHHLSEPMLCSDVYPALLPGTDVILHTLVWYLCCCMQLPADKLMQNQLSEMSERHALLLSASLAHESLADEVVLVLCDAWMVQQQKLFAALHDWEPHWES